MKVLPSQLSYEELMTLLESADVPDKATSDTIDSYNDIVPFLTNYNITPGDSRVSKKLLYSLYKIYSEDPVSRQEFSYQVGLFVEPKSEFFLVNLDNFAISKHIYEGETKIDKTKSITYQNHFNWFLKEGPVKKGNRWIEGFILFYIYKDFCKTRRVTAKLGYKSFHNFLKLHFESRRRHENRSLWFRINEDTFNLLTESEKNVIREARKKARGSKKKAPDQPESVEKIGL